MLLVLIRPITDRWAVHPKEWFERAEESRAEYAEDLAAQNESLLEKLIAEESQAYILEWAQELGINCRVSVACRTDENGLPFPAKVTVSSDADEDALRALSARIEAELGVPIQCQIFREEQSR